MAIWEVSTSAHTVHFGAIAAHALSTGGCNQPFRGWYWCPRKKWFHQFPCPFTDRAECDLFRRMAGTV